MISIVNLEKSVYFTGRYRGQLRDQSVDYDDRDDYFERYNYGHG